MSVRGRWRYRVYFILMDVLTAVTLVSLFQFATGPMLEGRAFKSDVLHAIVGTVAPPIAAFLMLAGSWRDEFAELCWQKAAATTVKWLFLAPLLILLIMAAARLAGVLPEAVRTWLIEARGVEVASAFLTALLTLFTLAFQYRRWRESR